MKSVSVPLGHHWSGTMPSGVNSSSRRLAGASAAAAQPSSAGISGAAAALTPRALSSWRREGPRLRLGACWRARACAGASRLHLLVAERVGLGEAEQQVGDLPARRPRNPCRAGVERGDVVGDCRRGPARSAATAWPRSAGPRRRVGQLAGPCRWRRVTGPFSVSVAMISVWASIGLPFSVAAVPADGVVGLEGETQRIEEGVAGRAFGLVPVDGGAARGRRRWPARRSRRRPRRAAGRAPACTAGPRGSACPGG